MSRAEGVSADASVFSVELPTFSGPFRALAELILEQKVDVCDVPLATVVEGFLAMAPEASGWSLEEATWFLATCALLLELKVGRLLPRHVEPDEEDLLGASPDLAYARGLELAAFRIAARDLARRWAEAANLVGRAAGPGEEFAHVFPDVMARVTPDELAAVAAEALRPPPEVDLYHVAPIRATVAEALGIVTERLAERRSARFAELVADCREPIHVVVRFLALLELYRDGRVRLRQAGTFGEIEVRWEAGPDGEGAVP